MRFFGCVSQIKLHKFRKLGKFKPANVKLVKGQQKQQHQQLQPHKENPLNLVTKSVSIYHFSWT